MHWEGPIQKARTFLARPTLAGRCSLVLILVALAFALEKVLPLVASFADGLAIWWPTNGITLALLLIARRRHWPWILLGMTAGTALSQLSGGDAVLQTISVAICNCVEVMIPALVLPRFTSLTEWLQKPRLVWDFVRFAVILSPIPSALVSAFYFHQAMQLPYWQTALRWGLADMVGIIIFTPLILVLISPVTYSLFALRKLPSTLGTIVLLLASSWLVFHQSAYPLAFLLFPVILLVATRTGFSGSVLAICPLALIATAATLHGSGPFALITGNHAPYRILTLQVFLILALLMAFPISVARVQQESTASQLRFAYLQMEALATADTLTGLANRRRFDGVLEAEWRRAMRDRRHVAILMLDVDNFKAYNDCYGHIAGDCCLQAISKAICNIPQRAGDLVARYGGEEFVVLLPGIDAEGSLKVAALVHSNVHLLNLPHQGSANGWVTVSVGCASMIPQEDMIGPAVLLEAADRALYAAKRGGRNQVYLYSGAEEPREMRVDIQIDGAAEKTELPASVS